ncbi:hypothetical protein ABZ746_14285 [Streptomyces sp. NPDC020096]
MRPGPVSEEVRLGGLGRDDRNAASWSLPWPAAVAWLPRAGHCAVRQGVGSRYEKTATIHLAGLHIAGIFLWSAR